MKHTEVRRKNCSQLIGYMEVGLATKVGSCGSKKSQFPEDATDEIKTYAISSTLITLIKVIKYRYVLY